MLSLMRCRQTEDNVYEKCGLCGNRLLGATSPRSKGAGNQAYGWKRPRPLLSRTLMRLVTDLYFHRPAGEPLGRVLPNLQQKLIKRECRRM